AKWLAPRIYRFVDAHPDIELRLAASLKRSDFTTEEVDAVIRFGAGDYPALHVEQLFEDRATPLASPSLVKGAKPLREPADLANHTLLHDDSMVFMRESVRWSDWLEAAGVLGAAVSPQAAERGPRFNHADHGIDAAIDGAGVVFGREVLAERDIRRGQLVAPFDLYLPTGASFWFCCPPDALHREKVKVFRNWLFDELARTD
ncbi:MAG: LysR substrate-binding domain-containing protein, partial [Pseudomonadota bacterium]